MEIKLADIIDSRVGDMPTYICMQTSQRHCIINEQYHKIFRQQLNIEDTFKKEYGLDFIGEASTIYNCHGLTFASKRTGIYELAMLNMILEDEYKEIKVIGDVIIGDVVVYYKETAGIVHSGIVVNVQKDAMDILPIIKILSKSHYGKEVVHKHDKNPYEGTPKFFRINHGKPIIVE